MASTQDSQKIFSRQKFDLELHEPSGTDLEAVAWLDLRDYDSFGAAVVLTNVASGGGIDRMQIRASAASNGANPEVIKDTGAATADQLGADTEGDQLFIECQAEEVRDIGAREGKDLRYVALYLEHGSASDESAVTHIRSSPRWAHKDLTTNVIAT